ncbi:hypothetical protein [Nocardioides sp.]|uniref:hypothetical protein n=1 Tax=Nocardioides sp. TaxID=35761 RepID=UPI002C6383C4|nr:hypothetical protein [Nocardioides sp.]HXH80338.1 hypothetical protein [Nocardioides sp.]
MSTSVATRIASASARSLCAGVALAIALMCAVLGVAASTTPMTGMPGMGEATVGAIGAPLAAMPMEMGGDGGPTMASMCESACVTDISGDCTVAAGLAVTALLTLFMATRRDTFLSLLARVGPLLHVRRRRRDPTPWTVPSLSSLCVLRV